MRNSFYTPLLTEPCTFVSALKSKIFNIVKAIRNERQSVDTIESTELLHLTIYACQSFDDT